VKLDFKLLPHQKTFVMSNVNSMLVGGYGSGKSQAGTIKTIIKKLQYPKYKVAYYLPTYPLIKDIAFDKFPATLSELGLKYKLNKSEKEIHIENYGTIIFRSMDNPDTIIGYETAYSLIDEADILPTDKMDKVYNKILGRNRSVDNANVDAVSTPEGFKWLYEQSQKGNFALIRAKTKDNKFLPEDYIKQLEKQYPEQLLRAYMDGEFVNLTSGNVYSYFSRDKHDSDVVQEDNEPLYIGQDFNIGGCISTVHVIRGTKVIRVDEFESHDTRGIIENIQTKYKNNRIIIYPDASGNQGHTNATKSDIALLEGAGFEVDAPKANPRVMDRINTANNMFEKEQYFINISRCPKGTKALEQQSWNEKGEPEKFAGAATVDDYNDSFTYFLNRKYGLTKPRFTIGEHHFG
jgi:PBSX family phage terminase large subunit